MGVAVVVATMFDWSVLPPAQQPSLICTTCLHCCAASHEPHAAQQHAPVPAAAAAAAVQPPVAPAAANVHAAEPASSIRSTHAAAPAAAVEPSPPSAVAGAWAAGGTGEPEVHSLQGVTLIDRSNEAASASSSSQAGAAGPSTAAATSQAEALPPRRKFAPRERAVPSSSVGRVMGFAQLGTSLLYGTMRESVSRAFGGGKQQAGDRWVDRGGWLAGELAGRRAAL